MQDVFGTAVLHLIHNRPMFISILIEAKQCHNKAVYHNRLSFRIIHDFI